MSAALELEGVRKSFGRNEVLRGIDLSVDLHEVVCLIGSSGSGKSTLLRCVNLIEPIDAGRSVLDGIEISAAGFDANRVRRRIGIVFQAFNLFPHMTVLRNVTLAPRTVLGRDRATAEARAVELLGRFGLADKRDARPGELSRGMRQKLQIGCALIRPHRLLVLDEPVVGLDPASQHTLRELLLEAKGAGVAVMLTTHQLEFARGVADRAVVLADGEVVADGPYDEVVDGGILDGLESP